MVEAHNGKSNGIIKSRAKHQKPSDKDVDNILKPKPQLPEKQFRLQESLLTVMFENPHIQTVRNMFIAILFSLFLNTIVRDYLDNGEIILGLRSIKLGFGNFHFTIVGWLIFYFLTCTSYFCFKLWAAVRENLVPASLKIRVWDNFWIFITMFYYIGTFILAAKVVRMFQLPPASAAVILIDQTRMVMKVHAFVRGNVPKVLNHKKQDELSKLPTFQYFIFFTFIPTLVYRDEYPRTNAIRWNKVALYCLEIVGVIFYYSFLINRYISPLYSEFGLRKFTFNEVVFSFFESAITGILYLLCTFYLVLHAWQNLFAELLRFGDRMFYKDWWTTTNYAEYYRTWNVVVHDWLYTYIYKDFYDNVWPGNKLFAKFAVFLTSAIVHEWVLTHMFGFFYPVLFIVFSTFGFWLTLINAPKWAILNVLFWYGLAFGTGFIIGSYSLEYYARMNLPKSISDYDFYVPRSLTCDCFK